MQIETKFKPGDTVYFIHDNKVVEDIVLFLEIVARLDSSEIKYAMTKTSDRMKYIRFQENEIFATKQELLNSL